MINYVALPLSRLQLGRALPVDVRSPDGRLLLRRGQLLESEAHREMLATHHACMSQTDANAWQRALEREMRSMRYSGVAMVAVARAPMPADILDIDYLEGQAVAGSWLDLQDILRGLLYQGVAAVTPLPRLEGIEQRALCLLDQDPDECLFVLFQALPDLALGYCATHALLSGVVGALTADKLTLPAECRALLLRSALVMNIGMARPQDNLARQVAAPNAAQRQLIIGHPPGSADILRGFGVQDSELLDLVHWHHQPEVSLGSQDQNTSLQLLHLADTLVAKMAPRSSRAAMSALGAAKSLVQDANAQTRNQRIAMASVLGFYPPGTYVQLINGEVAVVVARGDKATTPHVASLINAKGMPLSSYLYHDTRQTAVRAPVASAQVHIKVSMEKIRRVRAQTGV